MIQPYFFIVKSLALTAVLYRNRPMFFEKLLIGWKTLEFEQHRRFAAFGVFPEFSINVDISILLRIIDDNVFNSEMRLDVV